MTRPPSDPAAPDDLTHYMEATSRLRQERDTLAARLERAERAIGTSDEVWAEYARLNRLAGRDSDD